MSFRYFEVTGHAAVYNKFRHSPPEHLIAKIVNYVKEKVFLTPYSPLLVEEFVPPPLGTAVDVGCGGGQSTLVLSPHFQHVVGVDPSAAQIEAARKRNTAANVSFRVGGAEQTGLEERSAQLVAASQACHWFHLPRFYAEAGRVLAPSGVLAMYGYTLPLPTHPGAPCLGDVVEKYYKEVLCDYVPPESKKVYLGRYTDEEFYKIPFIEEPLVRDESTFVEFPGSVADVVGYVSTWSAFQNYRKQEGDKKSCEILQSFEKELTDALGGQNAPEDVSLKIRYNYFLIMGRKSTKM